MYLVSESLALFDLCFLNNLPFPSMYGFVDCFRTLRIMAAKSFFLCVKQKGAEPQIAKIATTKQDQFDQPLCTCKMLPRRSHKGVHPGEAFLED